MINALRDPAWQFVGVLLAVLSLAAVFWIYWLQLRTKELSFALLSSRRPLSIADELSSRVTVQLDGRSVGNLHLLVYGLKNSGRHAIPPTHFERPLSIQFSDGQVVSAEITRQNPGNLGANLIMSSTQVELRPLLLNPGDQLLIQVLLSSANPTYTLDGRVLDVSSFEAINISPRLPTFLNSGLPLMVLIFVAVGTASFFLGQHDAAYWFLSLAVIVIGYGLASRLFENSGKSARRRISEA